MVSVILPARNEPYLQQTINSLLENAVGEIEVIAILDGYWPDPPINDDKRVVLIHRSEARGMRAGINAGAAIARGDFLMKADAHCMFGPAFDKILSLDCQENWVMVPRRYPLDVKNWKIEERKDNKYPIDYMYLDKTLHGVEDRARRDDPAHKDLPIDDTMSNQGSVWFMPKTLFYKLDLMDEEHWGTFWNEFQEVGMKAWLGGYEVKVNKKTWYAHFHKNKETGRGYSLPSSEQIKGQQWTNRWMTFKSAWEKQVYPIEWLIKKFGPVPTWET